MDDSAGRICVWCCSIIKYIGDQVWIDRFQSETCPTSEKLHSPKSYEVENADSADSNV